MKKATQGIKSLIALGKTNAEIMEAVPKTTLQQIYNYRYLMKKEAQRLLERAAQPVQPRQRMMATPVVQQITTVVPNDIQIGGTHYKEKELQPWDAITSWGCGFLDGNVIKYVVRYRSKGGVEDLKKARHYLDKLIELQAK
jgi:uncharacterized protein YlzI (FlbEa/FlbD family)